MTPIIIIIIVVIISMRLDVYNNIDVWQTITPTPERLLLYNAVKCHKSRHENTIINKISVFYIYNLLYFF